MNNVLKKYSRCTWA